MDIRRTCLTLLVASGCARQHPALQLAPTDVSVILTSAAGTGPVAPTHTPRSEVAAHLTVHLDRERQTFLGIGGSLTQASAAALATLSPEKRQEVLQAYFGPEGAHYALSRTHIASSDFSEESYSYVPEADPTLMSFSVQVDEDNGLLPLIRAAKAIPGSDFALVASPWTAPAWMKDNGKLYDPEAHVGGRLLPEHNETFARYFVEYLRAYADEGIDVWAVTPVNEPQGNGGAWESMDMSAEEQRDFVKILGPTLRNAGFDTKILVFDQNRAEMADYTEVIYGDAAASAHAWGTGVHWYNSTTKVYEDVLDAQHARWPDKPIVHTEGTADNIATALSCADACPNVPCGCEEEDAWWQDDGWYWSKEATDWGWDWAPEREVDHPKYAPAFRYARDLVVGMNHWIAGWIDWNIALNRQGGPNHVGNWCLAPVMVDGETNTVYYTPLFHVLSQVSRHSRPGGVVLETALDGPEGLHAAAIRNPDQTVAVHVFNETVDDLTYRLAIGQRTLTLTSPSASLQTIVLPETGP